MARPVWEGHLRLSLVTCPVALFKATSEGSGVHFHLLHPASHNPRQAGLERPEPAGGRAGSAPVRTAAWV